MIKYCQREAAPAKHEAGVGCRFQRISANYNKFQSILSAFIIPALSFCAETLPDRRKSNTSRLEIARNNRVSLKDINYIILCLSGDYIAQFSAQPTKIPRSYNIK